MEKIKIFGKWSTEGVEVKDLGLKKYINLQPVVIPKTDGRFTQQQFHKSKMNIVERLINKLRVPGHRGKKHVLTSGRAVDKTLTHYKIVKKAFEIIEKQTGKNPIAVFVGGILAQIIGQLVVLWLSRQREYYADAHSREIMKDPMPLASALVKITYDIPAQSGNNALNTLYVAEHGFVSESLLSAIQRNDPTALKNAVEKEPNQPFEFISTHPSMKNRLKNLLS